MVSPRLPVSFSHRGRVAVVIWAYSVIMAVITMPASSTACMAAFGVDMGRLQHFFVMEAMTLSSISMSLGRYGASVIVYVVAGLMAVWTRCISCMWQAPACLAL